MKIEFLNITKSVRTGLKTRGATAGFLFLFLLMLCLAATPVTRTGAASPASPTEPRPTPPNDPLDADRIGSLVDTLADALSEVIADEEIQGTITDKWFARMESLEGKTGRQVVDLFITDARTVVTDAGTIDQLRAKLMAAAGGSEPAGDPVPPPAPAPRPAPAPGFPAMVEYLGVPLVGRRAANFLTPEVSISDDEKRLEGVKESLVFEGIVGQLRLSQGMQLSYKNQPYMIYQDMDDPDRQAKFAGINQGVKIMIDRGINLPRNLVFYISHDQNGMPRTSPFCKDASGQEAYIQLPNGKPWPKCMDIPMAQAFKRDRNWAPVARIVISSLRPPNEKSLSTMGINGLSKIPVTTIHEVCHLLHERFAGEFFWTIPAVPPANTVVSQYANKFKKEFVAEVCAGLILGIKYDQAVMTEYQQYRGPETSPRALGQIPLFPGFQRPR